MNLPPQPQLAPAVISVIREKGHLSGQDIEFIARNLRIPTSRVYGFCSQFAEFGRIAGRARLKICSGPACAAAGPEGEIERLLDVPYARMEVRRVPGLLQPHNPPALTARLPGDEERIVEGFSSRELEELALSLERGDLSDYPLPETGRLPGTELVQGGEVSPWLSTLTGKGSTEVPYATALREALRDPTPFRELLERECGFSLTTASARTPALLVCDTMGPSLESSVDLHVAASCPQTVAAGAVLAAVALGASKVVFYVPWDRSDLEASIRQAAEEPASAAGVEWEVFPGPVYIPCWRDVGVAAVIWGMMLWRAASICGRDGPLRLDPPTLVCGAYTLWKLPWILEGGNVGEGVRETRTLVITGPGGAPMWLELASVLDAGELEGCLERVMGGRTPRAYYMEGHEKVVLAAGMDRLEIPPGTRRFLALPEDTCMASWVLRMLKTSGDECCGGCAPGRTAPQAAAAMLESALTGGAGEEVLQDLAGMMERAELLALCPQLATNLAVFRTCLELFPEDFRSSCSEGNGPEHTVSGSGRTSGMGVRR